MADTHTHTTTCKQVKTVLTISQLSVQSPDRKWASGTERERGVTSIKGWTDAMYS